MRKLIPLAAAFLMAATLLSWAGAQPPAGEPSLVTRMMAFNTKKDGKLTKDQVTDRRLHRLFDLADANKDGVVTREELLAVHAKLEAEFGAGGDFGGKGPKGKGPKVGFGAPPRPGEVLPSFLLDRLELTNEQRQQLRTLQAEVDSKLNQLLTETQRQKLQELKDRGPGGKGPPPR